MSDLQIERYVENISSKHIEVLLHNRRNFYQDSSFIELLGNSVNVCLYHLKVFGTEIFLLMNLASSFGYDNNITAEVPVQQNLYWCALVCLCKLFDQVIFNQIYIEFLPVYSSYGTVSNRRYILFFEERNELTLGVAGVDLNLVACWLDLAICEHVCKQL